MRKRKPRTRSTITGLPKGNAISRRLPPVVYTRDPEWTAQGDMFHGQLLPMGERLPIHQDHTGAAVDASLDRPDLGKLMRPGWAYNRSSLSRPTSNWGKAWLRKNSK